METTHPFRPGRLVIAALLAGTLPSCQVKDRNGQDDGNLPNIVVLVADDLGTGHLGAYGHPNIPTPNLDDLAANGMIFTNAYCTSASCSASRSVILTGLFNHATGQYGHSHTYHHFRTYGHTISLPSVLKKAGYTTARIGKFHVAPDDVYPFDSILPGNARNGVEMAERSKTFLNSANQPFFLYFCTSDPHRGGGVADDIPTGPDRFGNLAEGYEGVITQTFTPEEVIVPDYLPDNLTTRHELAQYYQSVDRMDQGFGRLFNILKETGKWENTIIVFLSDNGIAFPGAKTNLYDPAMRLPLVFYYPPAINPGSVSDAMVSWADITPTLLDMAGLLPDDNSIPHAITDPEFPHWEHPTMSKYFHGRSFKPALLGNHQGFDEVYASHTFHEITMYYPMRVVQDRQYKLIWNIASGLDYPSASDLWESSTWQAVGDHPSNLLGKRMIRDYIKRPPFELYDMENDAHEVNNLAYRPEFATILSHYQNKIKYFQQQTNDPWIVKWEYE